MTKSALAAIASVCALWLYVFWQIRLEWIVNPMYAYGWTIPFLAGYLFYERWLKRPGIETPRRSWWHFFPLLLAILAIFPIRVIQEANPDWVKINWLLLGCCCTATYIYLWIIGGLRYVFHFLFPIAFTFTAVAWPYNLELQIIQGLMKINAAFSADFMTIVMGIPSRAEGNLVEVRGNWVNVEEACSGVRSLQTAFMMALFFGEFHNLGQRQKMPTWAYATLAGLAGAVAAYGVYSSSLPLLAVTVILAALITGFLKRLVLVFASFLLAFVLNVIRTSILTYLSGTQGSEAVDEWHDPLGYGILVFCIGGLWILAEAMKKRQAKRKPSEEEPETPDSQKAEPSLPYIPVIGASIAIFLAAPLLEAATEAWYRPHDQGPASVEWEVKWPQDAPEYQENEVPERTYALLKFNEYTSASWSVDRDIWSAYYIRWYPGRTSKFLAGAHYPTVCLPASGLELRQQFDSTLVAPFEGLELEFNTFLFDRAGQNVYVFHALAEDGSSQDDDEVTYKQVSTNERINSARKGYRNRGQRVIGVLIEGADSLFDARAAFKREFPFYAYSTNP